MSFKIIQNYSCDLNLEIFIPMYIISRDICSKSMFIVMFTNPCISVLSKFELSICLSVGKIRKGYLLEIYSHVHRKKDLYFNKTKRDKSIALWFINLRLSGTRHQFSLLKYFVTNNNIYALLLITMVFLPDMVHSK